jgi:hypothetical protein
MIRHRAILGARFFALFERAKEGRREEGRTNGCLKTREVVAL